jgi:hypothetical protein
MMMTPSDLRQLVEYDPETGKLTWKPRAGNPRFNNRLAGKPAFAQPSDGYLTGHINRKNYKAHRIAWAVAYGEWPNGDLDHINGDRSDNRIENLRVVDVAENARNLRLSRLNTSGVTGVSWFARDSKWWAKITVSRRVIHLGFFNNLSDAAAARRAAELAYGFHENHGRRILSALDLPSPPTGA